MTVSLRRRIFRGSTFPLACFSGAGLLITASDRLAHAITAFGALIWVFCLLALAAHFGVKIFPRRGRSVLLVFLASFIAGIFLFLLWLLSPLCAMESFFTVSLVPLFCMVSGIYKRLETLSLADTLFVSFSEALVLGILIIIFALIREPIGFLSLSLPGGAQGIVLLFSFETESFLPVRLVAGSSGALLLLGYILGLYRYIKSSPGYREEGK